MDKESLFININNLKNKRKELWCYDDIDNLLIIYKYKDCFEYYNIVLELLKKYITWRKIHNDDQYNSLSHCYTLPKLINVYLIITESLIINDYVNYYEIYDELHTKSLCEIFFNFSSDSLLMFVIIVFMIFRLFYYTKLIMQTSLNNNRIVYDNKYDNIFNNKLNNNFNNNKHPNLFGLKFELNNDNTNDNNTEKEELKNSNFDIKKIFKDLEKFDLGNIDLNSFNLGNFDLAKINLQDCKLEDFNLEKMLNIPSLMKENKNVVNNNSINNEESNSIKCKCHLCNNCINKKNI